MRIWRRLLQIEVRTGNGAESGGEILPEQEPRVLLSPRRVCAESLLQTSSLMTLARFFMQDDD